MFIQAGAYLWKLFVGQKGQKLQAKGAARENCTMFFQNQDSAWCFSENLITVSLSNMSFLGCDTQLAQLLWNA